MHLLFLIKHTGVLGSPHKRFHIVGASQVGAGQGAWKYCRRPGSWRWCDFLGPNSALRSFGIAFCSWIIHRSDIPLQGFKYLKSQFWSLGAWRICSLWGAMKYKLYEQRLKSLFKAAVLPWKIDQATGAVKNVSWKYVISANFLLLELMLLTGGFFRKHVPVACNVWYFLNGSWETSFLGDARRTWKSYSKWDTSTVSRSMTGTQLSCI